VTGRFSRRSEARTPPRQRRRFVQRQQSQPLRAQERHGRLAILSLDARTDVPSGQRVERGIGVSGH